MKIRTVILATLLGTAAMNSMAQSVIDQGYCGAQGNNLTWTLYSDSTLIIYGSGDMADYAGGGAANQPWKSYWDKIKTVTIGDSVTNIGVYAFLSCTTLTAVTIPNSVTSIKDCAFVSCRVLASIILPNSVTTIGNGAFNGCYSLTSITIPENVTIIREEAFNDCSSLSSVSIGSSVTNIGDYAFYNCSSLTAITCRAVTPPILEGTRIFRNVSDTIPIYVPCGAVSAYQAAWTYFSNFIGFTDDTTVIFDTVCYGTVYNKNGFNMPAVAGTYYRTERTAQNCDSIIELNLSVYSKQDTVIFNDTISYGGSYTQNGFNIINATSDSIYFNNNLNINNCDSVTQLILKITGVGIHELRITNYELRITNYELRIMNYELQTLNIELFDIMGRNVGANLCIRPENDEIIINISDLAAGTYFLKIDNKLNKFIKF